MTLSDQIRAWSDELARDPDSLVFLRLGEVLRQRNQLDVAERVVVAGLKRHPRLADAHDLLGKVLADQYDFEGAFDEWDTALQLAPEHAGAHKGLGFLYYRAGEFERAIPHLEMAADLAPGDTSIEAALAMVRELRDEQTGRPAEAPVEAPRASAGATFDPDQPEQLLVDKQGRALAGSLEDQAGHDTADLAAGLGADVREECQRAARMLDLGPWVALTVETEARNYHFVPPTPDTLLIVTRDRRVPLGRLVRHAEHQAELAAVWLREEA